MKHRRSLLALALAACAALCGLPPAGATAWLPPMHLDAPSGTSRFGLGLAADPSGAVVAAWRRSSGDDDAIVVATRQPGAARFGPGQVIVTGRVNDPLLRVGDNGDALVAWVEAGAQGRQIRAAWRPAGSTEFSAPTTVSTTSRIIPAPRAEVDAVGHVTLLWLETGAQTWLRHSGLAMSDADPAWSGPEDVVTTDGRITDAEMAVDGAGKVTTVWSGGDQDDNRAWLATKPRGGEFSVPTNLTGPNASLVVPTVGVNAAGDTAVAWEWDLGRDENGKRLGKVLRYVWQPAGGTFGEPADVSAVVTHLDFQTVVVAPDRSVTVVYRQVVSGVGSIVAVSGPGGGPLGEPHVLNGSDDETINVPISVELDSHGAVTVVWIGGRFDAESLTPWTTIQAARRESGKAFGAPVDLTPLVANGPRAQVTAADAAGHVTTAWQEEDGAGVSLVFRVFDPVAPTLTWSQPGAAVVGTPVTFRASTFDVGSGAATISWDFGDGTPHESSDAGSHTYAAAGTYTVTVTAIDGAGNTTTETRRVTVAPAPPSPPAPDRTAPRLGQARLKPDRLPTGHGSTLVVTVDEAALLDGAVERRRSDGRWVGVGTKHWRLVAGENRRVFYGKTPEQRLRSGRYRVHLVATDRGGNAAAPVTLGFRVDRHR